MVEKRGGSRRKQQQLFLRWGDNEVHTLRWFKGHKISNQLVRNYLQSGLVKKLGGGAYVKAKDKLDWQGALFAAQKELGLPIHVGGRSAFDLNGLGQYLNLGKSPTIFVIARGKIRIPVWIKRHDWGVRFRFRESSLFSRDLGLEDFERSNFNIVISSRERGIMEMIETCDSKDSFEFIEGYLEGPINIRSGLTQRLLESCNSIKVKRIFLYMLEYFNHPVLKKIDRKKINLGKGNRVVVKNGKLDKNFRITVPKREER